MMTNVFFCFFVFFSFQVSVGLKCYCDICRDENHTCETDGLCFTTTSLDDNSVITHSYRCFQKHELHPPEKPVVCLQSESRLTHFVIKCCNGYDYCNRDLSPTLAPPTTTSGA